MSQELISGEPTWLADAIREIQQQAVGAAGAKNKVHEFRPQCEPDHVYYLVDGDGKAERHRAEPRPRAHHLERVDQVGPLVNYLAELKTTDSEPVVWYDHQGVRIICDDGDRRDEVTLPLNLTPQIKELSEIEESGKLFGKRDFIRLLRITLKDCLMDNVLLNYVRSVKFVGNSAVNEQIHNTRESLGRDVELAAVNEKDCPEEVELKLRVFDDPAVRDTWAVRCAVEILVDDQRFRLMPYPLEIKNAIDNEVEALRKLLEEQCPQGTPIFCGHP